MNRLLDKVRDSATPTTAKRKVYVELDAEVGTMLEDLKGACISASKDKDFLTAVVLNLHAAWDGERFYPAQITVAPCKNALRTILERLAVLEAALADRSAE